MSYTAEELLNKRVEIITNDGRVLVGTLFAFDQLSNVVLNEAEERIYSPDGTDKVSLGMYIIRGDHVAVIGELDEALDARMMFENIKAAPLKAIAH